MPRLENLGRESQDNEMILVWTKKSLIRGHNIRMLFRTALTLVQLSRTTPIRVE